MRGLTCCSSCSTLCRNSIRDFSDNGKLLRVDDPNRYRTATGNLVRDTDYYVIARGEQLAT